MAQLVEQLIRNQQVAGSSPATSLEPAAFFLQKSIKKALKQPRISVPKADARGIIPYVSFGVLCVCYSGRSSRKFERTNPRLQSLYVAMADGARRIGYAAFCQWSMASVSRPAVSRSRNTSPSPSSAALHAIRDTLSAAFPSIVTDRRLPDCGRGPL